MDLRYVVDVSSFFLVESSGDSEANSDSISSMDCNIAPANEDDAESCCGSSDVACMDDCDNSINDQDYSEEDGHSEDDETSANRYKDLGNGNWTWQEIGLLLNDASGSMQTEQKKQPKVKADVSADMMNEEEQNRLFWDTCLAL